MKKYLLLFIILSISTNISANLSNLFSCFSERDKNSTGKDEEDEDLYPCFIDDVFFKKLQEIAKKEADQGKNKSAKTVKLPNGSRAGILTDSCDNNYNKNLILKIDNWMLNKKVICSETRFPQGVIPKSYIARDPDAWLKKRDICCCALSFDGDCAFVYKNPRKNLYHYKVYSSTELAALKGLNLLEDELDNSFTLGNNLKPYTMVFNDDATQFAILLKNSSTGEIRYMPVEVEAEK